MTEQNIQQGLKGGCPGISASCQAFANPENLLELFPLCHYDLLYQLILILKKPQQTTRRAVERHCFGKEKEEKAPSPWRKQLATGDTQAGYGPAPWGNPAGLGRSWSCLPQNCHWGLWAPGHSWAFGDSPSCGWGKVLTVIHTQLPVLWAHGVEQRGKWSCQAHCWHWEAQGLAWCPLLTMPQTHPLYGEAQLDMEGREW